MHLYRYPPVAHTAFPTLQSVFNTVLRVFCAHYYTLLVRDMGSAVYHAQVLEQFAKDRLSESASNGLLYPPMLTRTSKSYSTREFLWA
jgi:hypothetical protein